MPLCMTPGVRIAIVSNLHYDLRPEMSSYGFDEYVEAVVISSEHGIQKPDTRMFEFALESLSANPAESLMVGDSVTSDGAAASIGIDTLILPAHVDLSERGLTKVQRLVILHIPEVGLISLRAGVHEGHAVAQTD